MTRRGIILGLIVWALMACAARLGAWATEEDGRAEASVQALVAWAHLHPPKAPAR